MTQRGYPYLGWPLYHATANRSSVLEHGFLTRAQLAEKAGGRERHVVGGGTAAAISMTLDPRVGGAILIGLKVISRLVKGEMLLGDLLIAGAKQAPSGTADVIEKYQLTPERVLRYDEGLYPFYTRLGMGKGPSVGDLDDSVEFVSAFEPHPDRHYGDEVKGIPAGAVDLKAFFAVAPEDLATMPPERTPMLLAGWAPKLEVARLGRYRHDEEAQNNGLYVEMYKRMLAMSTFDAQEAYDPLFFLTNLDAMREIDEDELCIIRADCDAQWLCASRADADRLGVPVGDYWVSPDWYHSCGQRLDAIGRKSDYDYEAHGGDRAWEQPEVSDTVLYMGRAMAEVRVFDASLLTNLSCFKTLEDVEWEIDRDFDEPGHLIVAYPWFKARGN